MKTFLPFKMILALVLITSLHSNAQSYSGLVFTNPVLISGDSLQLNSVYLFTNVKAGTDATVTISELAGGATITKIDDNSGGLGYKDAFQPEVSSPNGLGYSYAVFNIAFFETGTNNPRSIDNVQATAIDIDGNALMKEFAEIDMNGGAMNYLASTLDISVLDILSRKFKGENVLGIEKTGIDTSAMSNMFTVTQSAVQSFTITAGTDRLVGAWGGPRQFSFFMKGFNYVAPLTTLPLTLLSFTAVLDKETVELDWTTSNEKNVSHFIVEKGYDGKTFSDAGVVFAYGNTASKSDYSFPDPVTGSKASVIYYRLRSVDIDGKFQYSPVRTIRLSKQKGTSISLVSFPNPATSSVNITIPTQWQGKKVSYELVNNSGQAVIRKETGSASQTENLQISNLARGFYIVRVTCNDEVAQHKIIKN